MSKGISVESLPGEKWKDVPGHPDYAVSNMGRVFSKEKTWIRRGNVGTWHALLLKSRLKNEAYLVVEFRRKKTVFVHRLVAKTWLGFPDGKVVNHKNGIKTDNRLCNLEWVTAERNVRHAYEIGTKLAIQGSDHGGSILSEDDALDIFNSPLSRKELSEIYGISLSVISGIRLKRAWKHIHHPDDRDPIETGKTHSNPAIGSRHGNATLNEKTAMEVYESTDSNTKTAKRYGVSVSVVGNIKKRRRWKHIHQ